MWDKNSSPDVSILYVSPAEGGILLYVPNEEGIILISCPKYEGSLDEKGEARTSRDPEVRGHEISIIPNEEASVTISRYEAGDYMYFRNKGIVRDHVPGVARELCLMLSII
jgi:hypothetical protein